MLTEWGLVSEVLTAASGQGVALQGPQGPPALVWDGPNPCDTPSNAFLASSPGFCHTPVGLALVAL